VGTSTGALPLHVLVEFAGPLAVVQCIARKQPQALMCGTNVGWIPLHAAAKCASLEVVQCRVYTGNMPTWRPLETASFSNLAASVPLQESSLSQESSSVKICNIMHCLSIPRVLGVEAV
jgi:hypothetical protein